MVLGIMEQINQFTENFKEWMIAHGSNPLLWICLFFGGVLIFYFTYHALHKHD